MKELNRFRQFLNEEIYTTEFKNYRKGKQTIIRVKADDKFKAKEIAKSYVQDKYGPLFPFTDDAVGFIDISDEGQKEFEGNLKDEGVFELGNWYVPQFANTSAGAGDYDDSLEIDTTQYSIDPNQTIFSTSFRDPMESLEVILYVKMQQTLKKKLLMLTQQYMDKEYVDSFKFTGVSNLGVFND
jgi:hypothetical protein